MMEFERDDIENILNQLEKLGFGDTEPRFMFCRNDEGLCLLGFGGSSYVYEMYDSASPNRHYAVKFIGLGEKQLDPEFVKYTVQLQYDLSQQSENILRVIDLWTMKVIIDDDKSVKRIIGASDNEFANLSGIILQMVFMEKLDSVISKDKYGNVRLLREDLLTEEGVISFAKQIGRALFIVHNNSILHRDVKLENTFWDNKSKQYKLGDFGVARYVDNGNAETVLFTEGYGAPEIEKRLQDYYNASADVYSFGITLYLLLNGLRFPGSESYHAIPSQYEKDFVVPAPKFASEEMSSIIRRMCSYRAEDRYQSVEEVLMQIGRIGGFYTDKGFIEECEDIETETYRDEESADDTELKRNDSENNETSIWEKDDSSLTREKRLKKEKILQKDYKRTGIWKCIVSAVLFAILFKSLSSNDIISFQLFWILPVAVLIEGVLQRVKEFHLAFGMLAIAFSIYMMIINGISVPLFASIISILLGLPVITIGCALGTTLWAIQGLTGNPTFFEFFSKHDLAWIVLVLLIAVIESFIMIRMDNKKMISPAERAWLYLVDKIWIIFIVAGAILLILEKAGVIIIPNMVCKLHLIRSGIGIFIIEIIYLWYYGPPNES